MFTSLRSRHFSAPQRRRYTLALAALIAVALLFPCVVWLASTAKAASTTFVISQFQVAGGTAADEFVELHNVGNTSFDLNGHRLVYRAASGTSDVLLAEWTTSTIIAAGGYYLVAAAPGYDGTPAGDRTFSDGGSGRLAGAGGGLALRNGAANAGTIIDSVGYGTATNAFVEGATTPAPGANASRARKNNGCQDTDRNVDDFDIVNPSSPRNSSSAVVVCGNVTPSPSPSPSPDASPVPVNQIQGSASTSARAGQVVTTTTVVVTGLRSNGFFVQTPDGDPNLDADANTSEGIFVFTGANNVPASAAIGNFVTVRGTVTEFRPSQDLNSPALTQLAGTVTVTLVSTGNALPAPVVLTAAETTAASETANPLDTLEEYEGMRVRVPQLTVIAPTDGNVNEQTATTTTTGVFQGVVAGVARPFREPGIEQPDPVPSPVPSPNNVPRFDTNPERIRVDSDAQPGSVALEVTTGATVSNLTGVLDYAFRSYTILPDAPSVTPTATITGNRTATPVPAAAANELTVGSFNLERFFDDTNDPNVGEPVLTTAAFNNRLTKASLAIREVLRTPDVLGIIEAENQQTLQTLANKINSDETAAGRSNPNYVAYVEEGNDVGGIDVGFLVKTTRDNQPRVNVIAVTQEGKNATFTSPDTGAQETLNDRPPLVLEASVNSFTFTVIVNHLRSLIDVEGDDSTGRRVRAKRRAQAEFLANLVQTRQQNNPAEPIALVGDFNAFEFNDGYVDSIGTIKGTPTPADRVVLASPDLVNPDLVNLVERAPAAERYSFVFEGNAQVLDHVIVNDDFDARFSRFAFAHLDADFPESFRSDPNRPERISDHDAPIAYFTIATSAPAPAIVAAGSSLADESCPPNNGRVDPGEAVTILLSLSNTGGGSTSDLVATLQPSANVIAPGVAQTYGALAPGATVSRAFTFTANGSPDQTIALTLRLRDGATDLGTATYNIVLGSNTSCAMPRVQASYAFSRDSQNNIVAAITLTNGGTVTANNVTLNSATLGGAAGQTLPQTYGTLAPGGSATRTLTFPGTATGTAIIRIRGTYDGASFSDSRRVSLP